MAQRKSSTSKSRRTRSKTSSTSRRKTDRSSRRKASQEVRTEMHHMKRGKHKVKSRKQAIAIGLSKARRKGAKIPPKSRSRKTS